MILRVTFKLKIQSHPLLLKKIHPFPRDKLFSETAYLVLWSFACQLKLFALMLRKVVDEIIQGEMERDIEKRGKEDTIK